MKSLTIHNLDDEIRRQLEQRAKEENLSLNRMINLLLAQALGVKPIDQSNRRSSFEKFSGTWSDEELSEFNRATEDFGRIDPGDWES